MIHSFELHIDMGNEAMQDGLDVARALERVIEELEGSSTTRAPIVDLNGNTVGRWKMY